MSADSFTPSIGIECHVQLKTRTKLFAAVGNDARGAEPNSLISHICTAMPGALPVLNAQAVNLAVRAGLALGSEIQKTSSFERKHYFYPDSPKGYQISQYERPIIRGGTVRVPLEGSEMTVRINRAQLEEDAGKNTHPAGADYSLVDLNRAGTPLLEIVSEPDIHSAAAAKAYARELYLLLRFADVSDCDMFWGNLRFDINVSVSSGDELGTRSEIKNLNSFRAVEGAAAYEIARQTELLGRGQPVIQETRGWDEAKQKTLSQRSKEEADDYRYMPEPDIPPVVIDEAQIAAARAGLPDMPVAWRERFSSYGLDAKNIETLLDAQTDSPSLNYLQVVSTAADDNERAKSYSLWLINTVIPAAAAGKAAVTDTKKLGDIFREVYGLYAAKKLNSNNVRSLIQLLLQDDNLPPSIEKYADEQGYIQTSDLAELEAIVKSVLEKNPGAADDVRSGEYKAIGFLVGQVMKQSMGKANPEIATSIIRRQLGAD